MKTLGYYNGKYGPIDEMMIPMNDRVCWFGDGVYDATYSRNHKIFNLKAHIDRFFNSAALLDMVVPCTKEELTELMNKLILELDDGELFVYWQLTRGTGMRGHVYGTDKTPGNLWITFRPIKVKDVYKKIKLLTMPDTRFLHCNIKTLNLIPSVMASETAERAGCDETVLHRDGRVTECAHSNVHILKDGTFRTAPTDNLILPGTARAKLIGYCRELGIPVDETPFTLDELFDADEIMISSAGSFCLAAEEIDGKPVGGKAPELLRKLQDAAQADFLAATQA